MVKSIKQFFNNLLGSKKRTRKNVQRGGGDCNHRGKDKVSAVSISISNPSKKFKACGKTLAEAQEKATKDMQTYEQEQQAKARSAKSTFFHKIEGERAISAYNGRIFKGTVDGKTAKARAEEYNIKKSGLTKNEYNKAFKLGSTKSSANTHYKHTQLAAIKNEASRIKNIKNARQGTTQELRDKYKLRSYNKHYGTLHNVATESGQSYYNRNNLVYNKNRTPITNLTEYEQHKMNEYALHGALSRKKLNPPKTNNNRKNNEIFRNERTKRNEIKREREQTVKEEKEKEAKQQMNNTTPSWMKELIAKKKAKANAEKQIKENDPLTTPNKNNNPNTNLLMSNNENEYNF